MVEGDASQSMALREAAGQCLAAWYALLRQGCDYSGIAFMKLLLPRASPSLVLRTLLSYPEPQ